MKLVKRNTTVPEPLPVELKRAVLTLTDEADGMKLDVRWSPGLYDPQSEAHREAYKMLQYLDGHMTRASEESQVSEEWKAEQKFDT